MVELSSKENLLRLIGEHGTTISIRELCDVSGLHPNTVRTHLDSLLAAGEIEREQAPSQGRGRPLWLYRSAVAKVSAYELLAQILASQLGRADEPALTAKAGKRWADMAETPGNAPAEDCDDAVDQVAHSLRNVGFAVSLNPMRDEVTITECPYASLVAEHPKICDVHAALISELLTRSGQPIRSERLDVWAKPGVCVAHLTRTDRSPTRTITHVDIAEIAVERTDDEKH